MEKFRGNKERSEAHGKAVSHNDLARPLNDLESHSSAGSFLDPNAKKTDRIGLGGAITLHLLIAAFLIYKPATTRAIIADGTMRVSIFDIPGDPPPGVTDGDEAPPEAEQAPETQDAKESEPESEAPAEEIVEEVSDLPGPNPAATEPSEQEAAANDDQAALSDETTRPVPSDEVGAGTIAIGAKSTGEAQGLDPGLSAAIGQAIAAQIRVCWDPPKTTSGNVQSVILARFNPDGTVAKIPDVYRIEGDEKVSVFFPTQYEIAAVKAIDTCTPIKLPASLYPYWKEIEIQIFYVPEL